MPSSASCARRAVSRGEHRRRGFELLTSVLVGSGGECSAQRLDFGVRDGLFAGRLAGTIDCCVPSPQHGFRAVDGGTSNLGFMSEVGFREATVGAFGPAGEQPVHRIPEGSGGAGAHLHVELGHRSVLRKGDTDVVELVLQLRPSTRGSFGVSSRPRP